MVFLLHCKQFDSGECELLYFLSKLGQFVNLFAFYFISFANFVSITRYTRLIHVFSMYIVYMWKPRLFLCNYRWPAVCTCMCTSCGSSRCSQREQWMWGVLLLWILNSVGERPHTLETWAATATHLVNVANSKQYAATVRAHTNWTCSEAVTSESTLSCHHIEQHKHHKGHLVGYMNSVV